MKHTYLHVAFSAVFLCWMRSSFGWVWILLSLCFLYKWQKHCILISCIILVFLQCSLLYQPETQIAKQMVAQVVDIRSNYIVVQIERQKLLVYGMDDVSFDDIVEFQGSCSEINNLHNFHQFDFQQWCSKRHIQYACNVEQYQIREQSTSLRSRMYRYVESKDEEQRIWLKKTLYGIQEEEETLSYLVTSSGMHLSFLASILQSILGLWLSSPISALLSLLSIATLGSLFSFKDALLRILVFRCVSFIGVKYSVHDRLGISVLLLLCLAPYMADELSFILPFAFRLMGLFSHAQNNRRIQSWIILFPLQFYYFCEVDVLQVLLFPLLRILYAIPYVCAILYLLSSWSWIYVGAHACLAVATCFSNLHLSFYYGAGILFIGVWFAGAAAYITSTKKVYGYLLLLLFLYTQAAPYLRPYMEVQMIDVGQGDCTLISLPFHQGNILIDVAGNSMKNIPADVIVPALHARGIRRLDYVIITHDDFDHSGGLQQLQELMQVDHVLRDKQEELVIGDFRFAFLLSDTTYADINENSLITYIEAYDIEMLFMGDAGNIAEQQILKEYPYIETDILKVGHHGSHTASSPPFIHQLHPSLALVSCGANNRYGHPSPATITTLTQENVHVLDTPTQGAVSIKLTNFFRFYNTARAEFGIIKSR